MKKKPLSHFESLQRRFVNKPVRNKPTRRLVRTSTFDETIGRMVTRTKYETISRVEEMKPYRVSDFCLENLVAVGAKLQSTNLTASPHKAISDMQDVLENIPSTSDN